MNPIKFTAALLCALTLAGTLFTAPAARADTPPAAVVQPNVPPTDADKAMAARAYAAAKLDPGTPGQEAMNFLMNEWPSYGLKVLTGETPVTEAGLVGARGLVGGLLEPMEKGPTWPKPSMWHIPHASGKIVIDSKFSDHGWSSALVKHGMYQFNSSDLTATPATTWRVTWDEKNLYFSFDCADTEIIAPPMARDQNPFAYDAVEMFVLPEFDSGIYWELVVGPQNAIYDGLHTKKFDGWGYYAHPGGSDKNIAGLQTATQIEKDANGKDVGYKIDVAIPFDQLPSYTRGNTPHAGDTLWLMMCRMNNHSVPNQDKPTFASDFYSVAPLLSWGHNIWNYIPITLEKSNYKADAAP